MRALAGFGWVISLAACTATQQQAAPAAAPTPITAVRQQPVVAPPAPAKASPASAPVLPWVDDEIAAAAPSPPAPTSRRTRPWNDIPTTRTEPQPRFGDPAGPMCSDGYHAVRAIESDGTELWICPPVR